MAILIPNAIGLLIPKCGSQYILTVLEKAEIPYKFIGASQIDSKSTIMHSDLNNTEVYDYFTFAFVRHPLSWYQSYWAYRMRMGWTDDVIDEQCADDNFHKFMEKVIEYYPDGYISSYYERYVGTGDSTISYVGRLERINEDLPIALSLCGNSIENDICVGISKVNKRRWEAHYTRTLYKKIASMEESSIKRFGY